MRAAYVGHGYLSIPGGFVKRYMPWQRTESFMTCLQRTRRLWRVKLWIDERRRVRFSAGWTRFVKENAIKVGDVCVFELIERDGSVMKVSIFRC
ncbi:hypothetical protein TIFTF001_056283 [Ficus carica]|nr:hypothetical protein TIFTF001_056283 [Ficus carica]